MMSTLQMGCRESCPVEACESCFSDITNILNWKYSIDGGETYAPQFFEYQLTGDNITIPVRF